MTNLKEVNFELNKYCGPAVLSSLTGKSTDECAAVISSITGQNFISGVKVEHLIQALKKLRFKTERVEPVSRFLFGSISALINYPNAFYTIVVPGHFVAIEVKDGSIYLIDNHTVQPIPAESSARLLQRVDLILRVIPLPELKLLKTTYTVSHSGLGMIYIFRNEFYSEAESNKVTNVGNIYARSHEELKEVISQLNAEMNK